VSHTRTVTAPFPVDLGRTLGPLRTGRHDPTILLNPTTVLQAMRTPDGPATLRAAALDATRFSVEAWGPGSEWALEHAPGYLGCLDDPDGFEPHHAVVARLQRRLTGLRLPRTGRVVEALIPAIMGQRVTGFEANRSFRLLVERWGEPAPGPGGLTLLPTVDVIGSLGYYDLHVIGMEKKRADTLQRVAAHAGRLEAARDSREVLQSQLAGITGVGAWTQAEVARIATGDPDAVSVGDYHLKHVVAWGLAQEPRGTDARMLELLAPYAGNRGRVCVLLVSGGVQAPKKGSRKRIEPIAKR
jgi:3-methyladenine DNA glycosylase/8-oxoguanine DNA glycosylase